MLEYYQAYATYEDLMDLTEEMVSSLVKELFGTLYRLPTANRRSILRRHGERSPWRRRWRSSAGFDLTVLDDPDRLEALWRRTWRSRGPRRNRRGKLITKMFEKLCEKKLIQPTFITQYPDRGVAAREEEQGEPGDDRAVRALYCGHGDRERLQ